MLSRIQPNLLGKPPKKPAKKLDPQLSPSVFRLLSPGRPKTLGKPKTPAKPVSPTQGRTIDGARKAPVGRKAGLGRKVGASRKAGPGRKAPVRQKVVEKVVEQIMDSDPREPVVQTRSGRNVVKTKAFEAGTNRKT
jgi:hypothetical protein